MWVANQADSIIAYLEYSIAIKTLCFPIKVFNQVIHFSYAHICEPNMHNDGLVYLWGDQEWSVWMQLLRGFYAGRYITRSLHEMKGC